MAIPGLTVVKKPLETYLIVRETDGDRELTAAECDLIVAALNPDRQKCNIAGLNALRAKYPNDLIFANAGFAVGVVDCVVNSTLAAQGL